MSVRNVLYKNTDKCEGNRCVEIKRVDELMQCMPSASKRLVLLSGLQDRVLLRWKAMSEWLKNPFTSKK